CSFYEQLERAQQTAPNPLPHGIYTLEDLRDFGKEKGYCPYYLPRRLVNLLPLPLAFLFLLSFRVSNPSLIRNTFPLPMSSSNPSTICLIQRLPTWYRRR